MSFFEALKKARDGWVYIRPVSWRGRGEAVVVVRDRFVKVPHLSTEPYEEVPPFSVDEYFEGWEVVSTRILLEEKSKKR